MTIVSPTNDVLGESHLALLLILPFLLSFFILVLFLDYFIIFFFFFFFLFVLYPLGELTVPSRHSFSRCVSCVTNAEFRRSRATWSALHARESATWHCTDRGFTASKMTRVLRANESKRKHSLEDTGRSPRGVTRRNEFWIISNRRDPENGEIPLRLPFNWLPSYNVRMSWCLLYGSLKAKYTGALLHFRLST